MWRTRWQPVVPQLAERARKIAARRTAAALLCRVGAGLAERTEPRLHHVQPDGTTVLLLPNDHPATEATRQFSHRELPPALVEIADRAPVQLREPVRALLWITGRLRVLDDAEARTVALSIAERQPDGRLLDLGHGNTALQLSPMGMVVVDSDGAGSVRPHDIAHAALDPFWTYEDQWLLHLEHVRQDVMARLVRLLPARLRCGRIRPLSLDRCGIRLRAESDNGDHDVRLTFFHPVYTPKQLNVELHRLVGGDSELAAQADLFEPTA